VAAPAPRRFHRAAFLFLDVTFASIRPTAATSAADPDVDAFIVPIRDGVMVARR
jgi:hypothetical protein